MYEEAVWLDKNAKTLILVKVKPNSKKTRILGLVDTASLYPVKMAISVSLNAKPMDNEANLELIDIISETFKHPKSKIKIKCGEHSRVKVLELSKD